MNQTIGVNITPQSFQPTLHYSQGDVGRVFVINVTDYDIPTGATVTCVATKPSGMGFTVSGTVSGNSVTFTSTAEMTDEWGRFPAEIRIASGNTLLGTANFLMIGEKDPHPASTIDGTQEELIPQLTLLVNRVEAAAESVHDLTVSATTLTAGSDATATYDSTNNSIAFGIPRGADGDVTRSEFNDLKSALGEPKYERGNPLVLTTTEGYWSITAGYVANSSYLSTKIPVNVGDLYAISTAVQNSTNFALAIFLDSSDNIIGYYKRSPAQGIVKYTDEIVKVPSGASYMCVTTLVLSMDTMIVKPANLVPMNTVITEATSYISPLVISGKYITAAGNIANSEDRYITDFIPCYEGVTVRYKGETNFAGISALTFFDENKNVIETNVNVGANNTFYTKAAPSGTKYVVLGWSTTASGAIYMLDNGVVFKAIETLNDEALNIRNDLFDYVSFNLINPSSMLFDRRHSIAPDPQIISSPSAEKLGTTGLIPVEEGEFYTVSGAFYPQGGYYAENATTEIGQTAIGDITFYTPVDGVGKNFQVPIGQNIKYVMITLRTNDEKTAVKYNDITWVQLEKGEVATSYQPYSEEPYIKKTLIPDISVEMETASVVDEYTQFGVLRYFGIADKIPNFREHWYKKDKDLVVVNTGTSLTARTTEHCTELASASSRPPMMQSNNFATHIWDALKWEGQQYRRYDYANFFTETGTFTTSSGISAWDDNTYREGLTRYSDSASSAVQFDIPDDAWQFNFIYRTDSSGSESCVVTVAEGDGNVEVYNGSSWVEANGYEFSMLESSPTTLNARIVKPDAPSLQYRDLTNYQVKGNTVYQKRLKMRCKSSLIDSIGTEKTVTISNGNNGRLLYWGVEWSPREFMITYINSARGSYNPDMTNDVDARELSRHQDSDIHIFKPDLYLSEDPIHNGGVSDVRNYDQKYSTQFATITDNFFFADNHVSLLSRGRDYWNDNNYTPEFALFNTSITGASYGGLDDDGNLRIKEMKDGVVWSAYDGQSSCYLKIKEDYPDVIYINACKGWIEACEKCFGTIGEATADSTKSGNTFIHGSHWNDVGCKVMARLVLPIILDL